MTLRLISGERQPWTENRMGDLWCWALDGLSLIELAPKVEASASECDLALWSMVGRTCERAAEIMNARRL